MGCLNRAGCRNSVSQAWTSRADERSTPRSSLWSPGRRTVMSVFKKQGVYWIDYYVQGRRKRERIGPDKRLAETVLRKRKVEIAEGRFLEKRQPITTTFNELADAYLYYSRYQQQKR